MSAADTDYNACTKDSLLTGQGVVSHTNAAAQALGIRTTAEGVETEGQLAFLHAQGCDEAQGYHFSTPLPATDLEVFMRQHLHRAAEANALA